MSEERNHGEATAGRRGAAEAHVVQNKGEAAYARSDLFERRRLMDDWGAYLAGQRRSGDSLRH